MTEKELKRLEKKVYEYETKLTGALEELAIAASRALGYDVVADLCKGSEIEFRVYGDNDVPDTDSCIKMEEVISVLRRTDATAKI